MKHFLLAIIAFFIFGSLSPLNATPEGQLTIKYTVDDVTYTIAGFEGNNPYTLVDGEKIFPKADGKWSVEGDWAQLTSFGFLLDNFRLYKVTPSFKQKEQPSSFRVLPKQDQSIPITTNRGDDHFLFWDQAVFNDITMVYTWIDGSDEAPAQLINIDQITDEEKRLLYLEGLIPEFMKKASLLKESETKGFPIYWVIDRNTQQIILPKFSQNEIKGRLNWLIKSGQLDAFQEEWAQYQKKIKYKKGEVTPLHLIALYQRNEWLTTFPELEKSFIKSKDDEGNTPAHYAAFVGNFDFFNQLKTPEKAVYLYNQSGFTPFHLAIFYGHSGIVEGLIEMLALQNQTPNNANLGPLLLALDWGRSDLFDLIYNHDSISTLSKKSPYLDPLLKKACYQGNTQAIKYLLKFSPPLTNEEDLKDKIGAAILSGNPEALQLFIDQLDSIPMAKSGEQLTYLHVAATLNESAMIPVLLDHGISINATTTEGVTPLFQAIANHNLESAITLLDLGADPDISPADGVSAIWTATFNGNEKGIDALVQAGAKCNLEPDFANIMVEYATLYDIPQVIQIALDQCLPEDYRLHDEFPGIYVADYFGSKEVIQFLEDKGQSLDTIEKPLLSSAKELDNPIKFIHRTAIDYPQKLSDKYGTLEAHVQAIINKAGFLILPKLSPPLPPELTKRVRETLKTWQIEPPTVQGNPTNIAVSFALKLEKTEEKEEIFELSQLSIIPRPIYQGPPFYPRELKMQNISGSAVMEFIVLEDGTTSHVRAKEATHPEFADAAIQAVKNWKFKPGVREGKAVKTKVFITIPFQIRQ